MPVPDSTGATIALLRELRPGRLRKQVSGIIYWVYVAAILVLSYGGPLIAGAARILRRPPPPTPASGLVLHAAPAALSALALLLMLAILRDARWRGPVTVPRPTADWLLGTPVGRARLLRPRFRLAATLTAGGGAVLGAILAAVLAAEGLGGSPGHEVAMMGAGAVSAGLLALFAAGTAALAERYQGSWRWLRRVIPVVAAAAAVLAGLAIWAAASHPPAVAASVVMWSGPWGWSAQWLVALAGGSAPRWPLAVALLGAAALTALAAGDWAAARVPGHSLRACARATGDLSAALVSMDTRGFALAYRSATARPGRPRFRLRPLRWRQLVMLWRDVLALARSPARPAAATVLALAEVGLGAAAGHAGRLPLLPATGVLLLGYAAAAQLCEGCRLDGDDPRRSAHLPFRYKSLVWRHAPVPCLILYLIVAPPVAALALAGGGARPVALAVVTVPVLVAGALVNAFRGLPPVDLLAGIDTPLGNTAAINVLIWYAWGPALAIVPMALLLPGAVTSPGLAPLIRAVVIGAGLATALGIVATRRADQRRTQ